MSWQWGEFILIGSSGPAVPKPWGLLCPRLMRSPKEGQKLQMNTFDFLLLYWQVMPFSYSLKVPFCFSDHPCLFVMTKASYWNCFSYLDKKWSKGFILSRTKFSHSPLWKKDLLLKDEKSLEYLGHPWTGLLSFYKHLWKYGLGILGRKSKCSSLWTSNFHYNPHIINEMIINWEAMKGLNKSLLILCDWLNQ